MGKHADYVGGQGCKIMEMVEGWRSRVGEDGSRSSVKA